MNNGMVISKVIFSQNLEMTIKACLEGVWGGESFELTAEGTLWDQENQVCQTRDKSSTQEPQGFHNQLAKNHQWLAHWCKEMCCLDLSTLIKAHHHNLLMTSNLVK